MLADWRREALTHLNRARRSSRFAERRESLLAALDAASEGGSHEGVESLRARARASAPHERVADLVADLFERLFDRPSTRLAVYGTLAPGERNAAVLASVGGSWSTGIVLGSVEERDGYRYFSWDPGGAPVEVRVLASSELPEHWARLDRFEGPSYRRTLVPVSLDSSDAIVNIYEAAARR